MWYQWDGHTKAKVTMRSVEDHRNTAKKSSWRSLVTLVTLLFQLVSKVTFVLAGVSRVQHCTVGNSQLARKQGQNLSITTKPFLPHHSLSTLSIGVPAHLLTVRNHYHRLCAAAAADVATGPSDVRACTPHASLGQPRHDALHGAVVAQEHLLLTLPKLYLQFFLLCVEIAVERVPR